jgi:ribonuclease HI
MANISIYTDGACRPNPGKGGWAAILIDDDKPNIKKEVWGFCNEQTTNNRMELTAILKALECLRDPGNSHVRLMTDSQYAIKVCENGLSSARINQDLVSLLSLKMCGIPSIEFVWVRGHAGNKHNERANFIAMYAMDANQEGSRYVAD